MLITQPLSGKCKKNLIMVFPLDIIEGKHNSLLSTRLSSLVTPFSESAKFKTEKSVAREVQKSDFPTF